MTRALLFLLAIVAGCSPKPAPEIRYVPQVSREIVAAPCPAPAVTISPTLAIEATVRGQTPARDVVQRCAMAVAQLQARVRELEAQIEAYRRPPSGVRDRLPGPGDPAGEPPVSPARRR